MQGISKYMFQPSFSALHPFLFKNFTVTLTSGDETVIDFNMLLDDIDFDWINDTRDGGNHLNDFGAQKVTRYLGEYLKKQYDFILVAKD